MDTLQQEINARLADGWDQVTLREYLERFKAIGYTFDRSCDCASTARYLTGERQGHTYPYLALYPLQADNRLSAWNVEARRDENYEAFKRLRNTLFAVSRGRVVEI